MELFSKSPKERIEAYRKGPLPITSGMANETTSEYMRNFMDFMADLPYGQGSSPESSEEKPEESTVPMSTSAPKSSGEFVKYYGNLIGDKADTLGLSKDMILAQIALETGWGQHAPSFNIGGIKADPSWKGKTQELMTTEHSPQRGNYRVKQTFRAYDTPEEGIKDYFNFLSKNKRYKPLFGVKDPYKAVDIMASTGYATDNKYRPKLYELIKQIQNTQV